MHPDEKMPNNAIISDLFDEIAGSAVSMNLNKPYTWINEHSSTHTQIAALAYQARGIRNNAL